MKVPRIVVVGSSNTDMVVKADRIPVPGETVTGGTFVLAPGGKGANQAVAAARLGAKVILVARVGSDMFGNEALIHYKKEAIDTSYIQKDPEAATGVALIMVDKKGENLISVASGANHRLTPSDALNAQKAIEQADIVIVQLETPLDTIEATATLAQKAGVPLLLDPAPAPPEPLPEKLMAKIAWIKPNETEACQLTGIKVVDQKTAQEAADRLLAKGVGGVIITLGTQGALLVEKAGEGILIPSQKVEAVDSTAAGDSFSGAFAFALASGYLPENAARFAGCAAALSVTKLGAQPSLPFYREVLAMFENKNQ